jgi:hypothetical protein
MRWCDSPFLCVYTFLLIPIRRRLLLIGYANSYDTQWVDLLRHIEDLPDLPHNIIVWV